MNEIRIALEISLFKQVAQSDEFNIVQIFLYSCFRTDFKIIIYIILIYIVYI
jgi:hypothetical protein